MAAALEVENLSVAYAAKGGVVRAVSEVSFSLQPGKTLGLVGESGCGKSSLGKAIMRLVEPSEGGIHVGGVDFRALQGAALRRERRRVQMVFQDPAASMNPRLRIGEVIGEPLRQTGLSRAQRRDKVAELMAQVGLRPETIDRFPHEFSGGQKQRVAIARAIALEPEVLICDEPVSALDVSLQAQVLNLLARLQREKGIALLFISHDLSVVQHMADEIGVMYLGRLVEIGTRRDIWSQPAHPYTGGLIESVPVAQARTRRIEDKQILGGDLPSPFAPPPGCAFHTRCPVAEERCKNALPTFSQISAGHGVACHLRSAQ